MRHHVDHRKLGRTASHRKALFRNMAVSLIHAERIKTTLPKAKELRRVAEKLITVAKRGDLHARRLAARLVQDDVALRKLFTTLAERFKDRQGGYTRIFKLGFRDGDSAPMAVIEYLGYQPPARPVAASDASEGKEDKKKAPAKPKKEAKEPKKSAEKPSKKEKTEKKEAKKTSKKEKTEKSAEKGSEKEVKKGGIRGLFGRKGKKEE